MDESEIPDRIKRAQVAAVLFMSEKLNSLNREDLIEFRKSIAETAKHFPENGAYESLLEMIDGSIVAREIQED